MAGEHISTAIILAGGLGLRLRPMTNRIPKAMVKVGGKPLVEWQVRWLRLHSIERIVFAAGYLWEKLEEHFGDGSKHRVEIDYSVEDSPLGKGGALKKALSIVDDNTFVALNSDIITDLRLADLERAHGRLNVDATILVVPLISPFGIVEISRQHMAKRFVEKPRVPDTWINGGIYIISRRILPELPDKGELEDECFPNLAKRGRMATYPYEGYWRTVDSVKDLKALDAEVGRLEI